MQGSRNATDIVVWRQFARKGYSAFASLHRVISIGVLSISTLSVAAKAHAQTQTHSNSFIEVEDSTYSGVLEDSVGALSEVTVSGTMTPLTQLQSARLVTVLTRQEIEQAAVQSVNDLLKLVTGVDVRQRGGFGIQTDISIDGGTCEQVTLLLNGIDITNPQTGHLSADFPVSISDIERIEVLQGAASRVYGGQSFGGAINIVTKHDPTRSIDLGGRGGSYGTAEGDARLSLTHKRVSNRISGGGGRSDGGTLNSSWLKGQLYYQGDYKDEKLTLDWQFGFSKKCYGANTFYSANYPDQYERNQRLMASASAEYRVKRSSDSSPFTLHLSLYGNRSWDNFELIHGSTFGENFHRTDVYGVMTGGHHSWSLGKTAISANIRHEGIHSTNLGRNLRPEGSFYTLSDNRTTVSLSLEHNILLEHWTISAGLMASTTSGIDHRIRLYPGIDIAWRPASGWKMFASYNKGYRLPSFTELYYKSPTHEGNRDLKPEHNHSLSLGAEINRQWSMLNGQWLMVNGKCLLFYHRGTQMIDWVMYSPDDIFHTAAFDLDNIGVEINGQLSIGPIATIRAGYTFIHQVKHDAEGVVKSNFVMEYLRHKFVASLTHRILRVKSEKLKVKNELSLTWDFRWQDRVGSYHSPGGKLVSYHPYAMLDAKLQWETPRYQLYVQATNITNHRYYDLGSVPQPGIWVMAGARLKLF